LEAPPLKAPLCEPQLMGNQCWKRAPTLVEGSFKESPLRVMPPRGENGVREDGHQFLPHCQTCVPNKALFGPPFPIGPPISPIKVVKSVGRN